MTKYIFATALLGLLISTTKAQDLDINGVKLGMTLDEARTKIGFGFQFSQGHYDDPNLKMVGALKTNEAWVFVTAREKLASIEHYRAFPPGTGPEQDATYKRLDDKYGSNPTLRHDPNFSPSDQWFFKNGKQVPYNGKNQSPASSLDPCLGYAQSNMMNTAAPVFNADHHTVGAVGFPTNWTSGCGKGVIGTVQADPSNHVVTSLSVVIFDQDALSGANMATQKAIDEANRKARRKAEQSQQPPL